MHYYDYGTLEMWAASPTEWTSVMQQEALGKGDTTIESPNSSPKGFVIALGVVSALLVVCVATRTFGTTPTTKGATVNSSASVSMQIDRSTPLQ